MGGMLHKQASGEAREGSPGESSTKGGRVFYPHRLPSFRDRRVSLRRDEELENRFVFSAVSLAALGHGVGQVGYCSGK